MREKNDHKNSSPDNEQRTLALTSNTAL